MNQTELKCFDTLLDAYTNQTMGVDERAAFEHSIEHDPAVRAKFELQTQVDESLVGMFGEHQAPASVMEAVRVAAEAGSGQRRHRVEFFLSRRWAMAALLFVSACVAWEVYLIESYSVVPLKAQVMRQPSMMEGYVATAGLSLRDTWTDTDGQDLAETFRWRQGVVLRIKEMGAGHVLQGKRHIGGISRFATAILFEVDAKDVVVFVDRVEHDQAKFVSEESDGLNIFVRYLGELVIYEVTPHDQAQLLDKFYEAGI